MSAITNHTQGTTTLAAPLSIEDAAMLIAERLADELNTAHTYEVLPRDFEGVEGPVKVLIRRGQGLGATLAGEILLEDRSATIHFRREAVSVHARNRSLLAVTAAAAFVALLTN